MSLEQSSSLPCFINLKTKNQISLDDIIPTVQDPKKTSNHTEPHLKYGDYLKSIVYGGVDGCTNSLIVILSAIASGANSVQLIAITVSVIVGDSFCMGLGDYLSAKAENDRIKRQRQRQIQEVKDYRDDQIQQVVTIYEKGYGYEPEKAKRLAELFSTNDKAFVNIMMLQELGLVEAEDHIAKICGVATFISFLIFGMLPALPYIITSSIQKSDQHHLITVIIIGAAQLFSLGVAKAAFIGLSTKIKSGAQILIMGSTLTAIGYAIGLAFH